MADLFDRIFVQDDSYKKIPVHTFHGVMVDMIEGGYTRAEVINDLELDAEATADLDALIAKVQSVSQLEQKHRFANLFHAVGIMAETGLKYTTKSSFRIRLGL